MLILHENEKIVRTVRQHGSVMAGAVSWAVIIAGLITFAFFKFKLDVSGYSWEIVAGVVLVASIAILYKIFIWRKNALIITNQRVILNERQGAFSRIVTELLYRDIYDISFKQVGIAALIYRYGKLIIKTPAGSEITFDKVPSPAEIIGLINRVRLNVPARHQEVRPKDEHAENEEG